MSTVCLVLPAPCFILFPPLCLLFIVLVVQPGRGTGKDVVHSSTSSRFANLRVLHPALFSRDAPNASTSANVACTDVLPFLFSPVHASALFTFQSRLCHPGGGTDRDRSSRFVLFLWFITRYGCRQKPSRTRGVMLSRQKQSPRSISLGAIVPFLVAITYKNPRVIALDCLGRITGQARSRFSGHNAEPVEQEQG